jgi:hypothetical protein
MVNSANATWFPVDYVANLIRLSHRWKVELEYCGLPRSTFCACQYANLTDRVSSLVYDWTACILRSTVVCAIELMIPTCCLLFGTLKSGQRLSPSEQNARPFNFLVDDYAPRGSTKVYVLPLHS